MEQTARAVAELRNDDTDRLSTLAARTAAAGSEAAAAAVAAAAASAAAAGKVDASNGTFTAVGLEGGQANFAAPTVGGYPGWSFDVDGSGRSRILSNGVEALAFERTGTGAGAAEATGTTRQPHGRAHMDGQTLTPSATFQRVQCQVHVDFQTTFIASNDEWRFDLPGWYLVLATVNVSGGGSGEDIRVELKYASSSGGTYSTIASDEVRGTAVSWTWATVWALRRFDAGSVVALDAMITLTSGAVIQGVNNATDYRSNFAVCRVSWAE